MSAIYAALMLIPLLGIASLAIDIGRVRLARAQLQTAADAAARAGVSVVASAPVPNAAAMRQRAADLAALNTCLGTSVAVDPATEVDVGLWDPATRTFTLLADAEQYRANAARVRAYRTVDHHGSVPLLLAPVLDVSAADVHANATAYITGGRRNLGIIGLDKVDLSSGPVYTDSYDADAGPYPGSAAADADGHVASNGDITFKGSAAKIHGDARPGIGHTVAAAAAGQVTGWAAPLDFALNYPADPTPAITQASNDNAKLPAGSVDKDLNFTATAPVTLPGGTGATPTRYYLKSIQLSGNAVLTFNPHVQVYVYGKEGLSIADNTQIKVKPDAASADPAVQIWTAGDVKFGKSVRVNADDTGATRPKDLYLSVTAAGTKVTADNNDNIAVHLYAPLSDMTLSNHYDIYGRIVAKTIDAGASGGQGGIHYDESLNDDQPWVIHLVQ